MLNKLLDEPYWTELSSRVDEIFEHISEKEVFVTFYDGKVDYYTIMSILTHDHVPHTLKEKNTKGFTAQEMKKIDPSCLQKAIIEIILVEISWSRFNHRTFDPEFINILKQVKNIENLIRLMDVMRGQYETTVATYTITQTIVDWEKFNDVKINYVKEVVMLLEQKGMVTAEENSLIIEKHFASLKTRRDEL